MKHSEEFWRDSRPTYSALDCVQFCLNTLFKEPKLVGTETIGERLTVEELLGALLLAEDELLRLEESNNAFDKED